MTGKGIKDTYSYSTIIGLVAAVLFCVGSIVNCFSLGSIYPVFAALVALMIMLIIVQLLLGGGVQERRSLFWMFSICWFNTGIATVYAVLFADPIQLTSDSDNFFQLATVYADDFSMSELGLVSEGQAAIIIWKGSYDFFEFLGFPQERIIGVIVNICSVSITAVLFTKIFKAVCGTDDDRVSRAYLLFGLCGLFWLFASIHLRDAFILLSVTVLIYSWVKYFDKRNATTFFLLVIINLIGFLTLGLLRTEFVFVPIALLLAGMAALSFYGKGSSRQRIKNLAIVMVGLLVLISAIAITQADLINKLVEGYTDYKAFTEGDVEESGQSSLGYSLIVNQPLPIRLVLGSVYLFVFPIPFWRGFQLETVYDLFKAFNVIYFYFLLPMFYLGIRLLQKKEFRNPKSMFLLFTSLGFILAIATTSLETRHFGAFLVPILVLATSIDLRVPELKARYRRLRNYTLLGMGFIHIAWVIIKL